MSINSYVHVPVTSGKCDTGGRRPGCQCLEGYEGTFCEVDNTEEESAASPFSRRQMARSAVAVGAACWVMFSLVQTLLN